MSNVEDSDLEEGEILDSPPSPTINNKKGKELPRRYDVRENKNNSHKHKKDCKYAIRHHVKKLSKLKTSPKMKSNHKNYYNYTCSHKKSHKVPKNSSIPKNGHFFPQQSLIAEMQTSIKSLNINKQSTKSEYEKTQLKKQNTAVSQNGQSSFQTLNIKSSNGEIKPDKSVSKENKQHSNNAKERLDAVKQDLENKNKDVIPNKNETKDEESEDEEELRRKALATFAKRKAVSENVHESYNIPIPQVSKANVQISHETSNPASDNYEVVDMEIDDDVEDSGEIIQTVIENHPLEGSENLFVIDTSPCVDTVGNKENSCLTSQPTNNSSDEEFEADILRAELIDSMFRKKSLQDEQMRKSKFSLLKKQKPVSDKKFLVNFQKANLSYHKIVRTAKHTLRKSSINKSVNLKNIQNKAPLPIQAPKPPERLIIALNDESSSDESDTYEEVDTITENPVESIVALISDCRQKSDSTSETKGSDVETKKTIPKAVSCLSKAQQEEYNSLMKILAEKKKLPVAQATRPQKNGSCHSPLDDLKQLEGKLVGLKDALKKKKESVASLSKEVNSKKFDYMKAKLSAQHLKEQLIRAEQVRKSRLLEWSRSCDNLKITKQSVLDLEKKMDHVHDLCNKIGLSIKGQSYTLPVLLPSSKES